MLRFMAALPNAFPVIVTFSVVVLGVVFYARVYKWLTPC
jgi:hypothetical protein